jgi:hypothetical protein
MQALAKDTTALDISLGGARIYSDFELTVGSKLPIELRTSGCPGVFCTAEVARVVPLGSRAPAPYEVGLRFVHFDSNAVKVLLHVLGRDGSWRL